jgi:AcrR family transcriptional regulator
MLFMEISMSRRERERLSRKKAMLDAAREVFAEKGFRRATLDEIAHRAEFGKGTLYNYFEGGKDEMLLAIVDEFYEDMSTITQSNFAGAVLASSPFGACLLQYFKDVISYFHQSRELFVVMMKESTRMLLGDDEEKAEHLRRQHTRIVDLLIPAIDLAVERSELKPQSSFVLAHTILGNLDGFLRFSCWNEVRSEDELRIPPHSERDMAEILADILMDGMGVREPALRTEGAHTYHDTPTSGS